MFDFQYQVDLVVHEIHYFVPLRCLYISCKYFGLLLRPSQEKMILEKRPLGQVPAMTPIYARNGQGFIPTCVGNMAKSHRNGGRRKVGRQAACAFPRVLEAILWLESMGQLLQLLATLPAPDSLQRLLLVSKAIQVVRL
jgi:hypothetical protein